MLPKISCIVAGRRGLSAARKTALMLTQDGHMTQNSALSRRFM
jgi:hypothetical protein